MAAIFGGGEEEHEQVPDDDAEPHDADEPGDPPHDADGDSPDDRTTGNHDTEELLPQGP